MENKKYYVRENGEKIELSTMNTTHLKNAMAKKMEELLKEMIIILLYSIIYFQ